MSDIIKSNISEDELMPNIVRYINSTNKTVSVIEDCTGGATLSYLAIYLQDSLVCGIYYPSLESADLKDIREGVAESKTTTMRGTAQEICEAQLSKFKTDIALTITGYVGNAEGGEYSAEAYIGIENTSGVCKFQPVFIDDKMGLSVRQQMDYIKRVAILTLSTFVEEVSSYSKINTWGKS